MNIKRNGRTVEIDQVQRLTFIPFTFAYFPSCAAANFGVAGRDNHRLGDTITVWSWVTVNGAELFDSCR